MNCYKSKIWSTKFPIEKVHKILVPKVRESGPGQECDATKKSGPGFPGPGLPVDRDRDFLYFFNGKFF